MASQFVDILPIFPLSGALLLPGGMLPLNIFEPRYLAMIQDALATPDRLIGMIQPDRDGELHDVGCAGRVAEFRETDDGRYLITLKGVRRFRITQELAEEKGYRRITPDWSGFEADGKAPLFHLPEDISAGTIASRLCQYLQNKGIECDTELLSQVTPDDPFLTSIAMLCPIEAPEKQALLECRDPGARTELLMGILEMGCCGGCGGAETLAH